MKLGLFLLISGLVLAGVGIAVWSLGPGGSTPLPRFGPIEEAIALGLTVFGGGLAIGGIVRMIVKR